MLELPPLSDLRVVELTTGLSGAYAGKMLADAGAEVIMVEPEGGSPLRSWHAREGGGRAATGSSEALFNYLAAGKSSAVLERHAQLSGLSWLAAADVFIVDETVGRDLAAVLAHLGASPSKIIASITTFGTIGPYVDADIQANEFILQAMCGSTGSRGWPGEEPLQSGGRIGEWVAGAYAAVAVVAAARRLRRTGRGDVIDLSVYESMIVSMGGLQAVTASILGEASPRPERSIELPSIVATADGLVGFCTVTGQQFQDFLILIDRPDLMGDPDLASAATRVRRRDEFLAMVESWCATRTTDEIIELAASLRIPVSPIGRPSTVQGIDHFKDRGVFEDLPDGSVRPRPPYRTETFSSRPPAPSPGVGESSASEWTPRPQRELLAATGRPLEGVRVLDFTAFWAGPVASGLLATLGANVVKVEGLGRPDGMRFSAAAGVTVDRWWEWSPVFLCSNTDKRGITLELSDDRARQVALELVEVSDVIIENFSPRVMANLGLDTETVLKTNPDAVLTRMPAFGLDGPWRDRVGFAQTMEQASGMAWMTGAADGPPIIPRGVCDPIAGLHAAFATIVALEARDAGAGGMQLECTMVEAALNVAAESIVEYATHGVELSRDRNRGPGAAPQGVYPTSGIDEWMAIALLKDECWPELAALIGRRDLAGIPALATEQGRRAVAEEIDEAIRSWTTALPAEEAVALLRAAGVAAARVVAPDELLRDPQALARDFWEEVAHPVVGNFLAMGLPFRLESVEGRWIRSAAPTLGEHTETVLLELGRDEADLASLADAGLIGDRPKGL